MLKSEVEEEQAAATAMDAEEAPAASPSPSVPGTPGTPQPPGPISASPAPDVSPASTTPAGKKPLSAAPSGTGMANAAGSPAMGSKKAPARRAGSVTSSSSRPGPAMSTSSATSSNGGGALPLSRVPSSGTGPVPADDLLARVGQKYAEAVPAPVSVDGLHYKLDGEQLFMKATDVQFISPASRRGIKGTLILTSYQVRLPCRWRGYVLSLIIMGAGRGGKT